MPVPFDLASLPEGFRTAVEREFSPSIHVHGDPLTALVWAICEVWDESTAKQRLTAEPSVDELLGRELKEAPNVSYLTGIIGARCLDLSMNWRKAHRLEPGDVLRGVKEGGGVRVNSELYDLLDKYIGTGM
jgi:hypothetical protein